MTVTPRRRFRRAALLGALCALAVTGAGLTGCRAEDPDAGTNGVGKLPAAAIHSKALAVAIDRLQKG